MEYNFKGQIKSYKNYSLPFVLNNGRLRLDVSSVPFGEINAVDANGNIVFSDDLSFNETYLEGITDDGNTIKMHVKKYYDADYSFFNTEQHYIGGIVSSCIVLNKGEKIDNIDKVSFFSYSTAKMLGCHVSGAFTKEFLELTGFNNDLAYYIENNNKYYVCHDFLDSEPFCQGQVISVKSDKPLTMEMMEDIYWTIRKFFVFMFQIKEPPINDVYLMNGETVVGQLFVRRHNFDPKIVGNAKCLSVNSWQDKLSNLFQALVDKKIYLRHLPDHGNEKSNYSPARFLTTVIGFESILNALNIGADYSDEHRNAIGRVKSEINVLKELSSNKYEKKEYSRALSDLEHDRLECRYENAIKQNEKYIKNFYDLSDLGESIQKVACELAVSRNNFSHGNLEEDLSWEHAKYCDFLDLFILFLQLDFIGVPKNITEVTVPQIIPHR